MEIEGGFNEIALRRKVGEKIALRMKKQSERERERGFSGFVYFYPCMRCRDHA